MRTPRIGPSRACTSWRSRVAPWWCCYRPASHTGLEGELRQSIQTPKEARRNLKRRPSNTVYRRMPADHQRAQQAAA
jgi:hypothetical protein